MKIIKGNCNEKERGRKWSLMILFSQEFLTMEHCYSGRQRNEQLFLQWELYLFANSVLHCSGSIQAQWLLCKSSSFSSFQKGLMTQCLVISFLWTKQEKLLPDWPALQMHNAKGPPLSGAVSQYEKQFCCRVWMIAHKLMTSFYHCFNLKIIYVSLVETI